MSISKKPWNSKIQPGDLVLYRYGDVATLVKGFFDSDGKGPTIWKVMVDGKVFSVKHWEFEPLSVMNEEAINEILQQAESR